MFDRRSISAVVCLLVCVVSFAPSASSTQQSTESAQVVLERALQALGGLECLKQIDSIYLKGKGSEFRSADLQGPDPDSPTRAFHEETVVVLPLQNKLLYEHRTGRHDGSFRWRRWMYAGEQRTVLDLRDEFISNVQRDPAAARERARLARIIPHLLLIEAANNSAQLQTVLAFDYKRSSLAPAAQFANYLPVILPRFSFCFFGSNCLFTSPSIVHLQKD